MSISTAELEKAIISLESALELHDKSKISSIEQKAFRDACIQRFEYTVEISWKVSVKIMGSTTTAAKIAVREMARNKLIPDPQIWFDFIDARNETSHSYDEDVAQKIFLVAKKLPAEARALLDALKTK